MAVRESKTVSIIDNEETGSLPSGFQRQDQEENEDDFSLSNVLAELGSGSEDAKVNVYQIESGKPNAFVDSFSPGDFSLEGLKQTYGAGTYHIQVRANGRIVTRRVVRIAKPSNQPGYLPVPQPANNDRLIETMQVGFQKMGEMFAGALAQLSANNQPQKTTKDMLEEMMLMKQIVGGESSQGLGIKDVLDTALALSEKINPNVAPADDNSLLLEGVKTFGRLIQTQLAQNAAHVPARTMPGNVSFPPIPASASVQVPAPAPAFTVTTPSVNPPTIQESPDDMVINMYIRTLVANAKADNDPVTYANVILDLAGDAVVKDFISRPNWFDEIVKRNPEAVNYREWFDELRSALEYLTNPAAADIQEAGHNSSAPADAPEQPEPATKPGDKSAG